MLASCNFSSINAFLIEYHDAEKHMDDTTTNENNNGHTSSTSNNQIKSTSNGHTSTNAQSTANRRCTFVVNFIREPEVVLNADTYVMLLRHRCVDQTEAGRKFRRTLLAKHIPIGLLNALIKDDLITFATSTQIFSSFYEDLLGARGDAAQNEKVSHSTKVLYIDAKLAFRHFNFYAHLSML